MPNLSGLSLLLFAFLTPGAGKSSGVPGKGIDLSGLKGLAAALVPGALIGKAISQGIPAALRGDMFNPSLGLPTGPSNMSASSVSGSGMVGHPGGGIAPATGGRSGSFGVGANMGESFGVSEGFSDSDAASLGAAHGSADGYSTDFAEGGLIPAFKAGDKMENGSFIFPADALSDLGNGSSSAGLNALNKMLAKKGAPRAQMIRGKGDGQDDKIRSSIDGIQPALLSKEEAYISAAAVTRLGNGDAKKGAKKLYDMMRNVRKAAHGTTKQSRRVNPNKIATA